MQAAMDGNVLIRTASPDRLEGSQQWRFLVSLFPNPIQSEETLDQFFSDAIGIAHYCRNVMAGGASPMLKMW